MTTLLDSCPFDNRYDNYIIHSDCKDKDLKYQSSWGPTHQNPVSYKADGIFHCPPTHEGTPNHKCFYAEGASHWDWTIPDICTPKMPTLEDDTAKLRCCFQGMPVPADIIIPEHEWIDDKFAPKETYRDIVGVVKNKKYAENDPIGYCPKKWCPATPVCNEFMQEYCGKKWDDLCQQYTNKLIDERPEEARDLALLALRRYNKPAGSTGAVPIDASKTHDQFADMCRKLPGLCQPELFTYCSSLTSFPAS